MSLIPPLARLEALARADQYSTHYGNEVKFRAPCPCGGGPVWWHASRADTALAKPAYDIRCKHPTDRSDHQHV